MAYTTEAAVRAATGFNDEELISDEKIVSAITDADSVINAAIGSVYSLPLASTPGVIEAASKWIAISLLYGEEYGEESQDTDKGWAKKLDWAMKLLDKVRDGELRLFNTSGEELNRVATQQVSSFPDTEESEAGGTAEPQFSMTNSREF